MTMARALVAQGQHHVVTTEPEARRMKGARPRLQRADRRGWRPLP